MWTHISILSCDVLNFNRYFIVAFKNTDLVVFLQKCCIQKKIKLSEILVYISLISGSMLCLNLVIIFGGTLFVKLSY